MKIKTKIALRYSIVTAILMTVFATVIYFVSAHDREVEFYDNLYREGVSKANLFFEAKASPDIMHSIYKNNIEYIDEVEVAVYDTSTNLLYHDAKDIDIVKETPELIQNITLNDDNSQFRIDKYQAVAFLFNHNNSRYVVTAAAYDGYGYSKLHNLIINLAALTVISIIISFILGYFLAKRALKPVSEISEKMKSITANNLDLRILGYNENDEFGELSASFNKALDIIESSFESQKMFVSNVSHELRTPLSILVGEIDFAMLKQRSLDEYISTLKNSKQDVEHLIKLVNGLLDLAKASYNEKTISMIAIRVDEILLDAHGYVLKANPNYSIQLIFEEEIEDDFEFTVLGNEYLLKTAFINLIENSCKFSQDKTSSIKISSNKEFIRISFSDNGIGISESDMSKIFVPFYRGDNKEYSNGYGIGLTLVDKVINLHKGRLSIHSQVNEGTSIHVDLPYISE